MAKKKKTAPRSKRKPKKRELLTRRELASALGVHMMTVTKFEREGMPIAQRGSKGRPSYYREVDVRAWKQLRDDAANQPGALNLMQERANKERWQAALAKQTLEIRNRELLPRAEVEQVWAAHVAAVRTKLLAWSLTLADKVCRVATTEGVPAVEAIIEEAVRDVLRELAAQPPPGDAAAA